MEIFSHFVNEMEIIQEKKTMRLDESQFTVSCRQTCQITRVIISGLQNVWPRKAPKEKNSIFTYHNSANNITKHLFWKQSDHAKQNVHKNFDISTSVDGVISTLLGADFDKQKMIQNFKLHSWNHN